MMTNKDVAKMAQMGDVRYAPSPQQAQSQPAGGAARAAGAKSRWGAHHVYGHYSHIVLNISSATQSAC